MEHNEGKNSTHRLPGKQGLYDPANEKDSCGVGFIVSIDGIKSNKTVKDGIHILERLTHRGAVGADPKTGDGAGILIQLPHEFLMKAAKEAGIGLPDAGDYGMGLVFLPKDATDRMAAKKALKQAVESKDQELLGWRKVPVYDGVIGELARESEPVFEQVFIKKNAGINSCAEFERVLYIIRKKAENAVRALDLKEASCFYITNISSKTCIYKGLMLPGQIADFFTDLKDPLVKSALCMVHSRYSTNTFPTWDLAQPFRCLAHNGEINTLRGNINWMKGREGLFKSAVFGEDTECLKPVIRDERQSDSASIDNAFEMLVMAGRSMQHAMMMLVPEAWEHNDMLPNSIRSFYKYHATFMEPWDGPAALAFTDGDCIGAVLDRNGLRPGRYFLTNDNYAVMASEAGVLGIAPENIKQSGRLEPGKMFFIDTVQKRLINDHEIKDALARHAPYRQWRKEQLIYLEDLPAQEQKEPDPEGIEGSLRVFGYTREDIKDIIAPMARDGKEPLGSMGNDTPHAVLSNRPKLLYNYFKQLFAQVTNPPIDSEREDIVMSLRSFMGAKVNIFDEIAQHTHKLQIREPILTNEELAKIKNISVNGFRTKTITLLYMPGGEKRFIEAMDRVCEEAVKAVHDGYAFIILSDKGVTEEYAAIPALLATGAVHQELVRRSLRTHVSLILESGEPREVHHMCVLFGYGMGAINPYLAYEAIKRMAGNKDIDCTYEEGVEHYRKACHKGLRKVMAKMGISTIQSYRGAQIFEALGLHDEVMERCFKGTASRISGAGFAEIARETEMTHASAYNKNAVADAILPAGGIYQWKKDGEKHLWNPDTIAALQDAVRHNDAKRYGEFAEMINNQSQAPVTLRSLLKFRYGTEPVPIEQVESVEEIVKRFVVGAMSFGSISGPAHQSIAVAMNKLGGRSNTGEGGEDPARFKPFPNGDSARSAIKQVASGRFGVTINYLTNADELQIKIAQGAKPGEGGQLPGHKVSEIIARTRCTTPGVTLISPPPHHDIYSIEDLKQLIFDLKNANPRARISVKLVSELGVGTVAAGVAKGHADMILISGGDGGTGASPRTSIMHAGMPWELGLSEAHQTLVMNNLRGKVRLQTDGQLRTGRDVAIAACLGAEEFGFGTAALITMGCVMLRHCHLNNCALGIATQEEMLLKRFSGRPEYLMNFMRFVAQDLREIMALLGIRKVNELVGRTDLLEINTGILPWKASKIDYSKILYRPKVNFDIYCRTAQDHEIDRVLDRKLIKESEPALSQGKKVMIESPISNTDRSCGAMLSGEVCRRYGEEYLPEDTIWIKFKGIAGQSFGAFLAKGITFELSGMANDYVGKGISGGRIIAYPDKRAVYNAGDNVIIGNTTFYGAIDGEAYINGTAGERFCIRNSGLYAVVEGTGDHGCEYMTGGRVVVIGNTGRNFAAGMSGGIAYVLNDDVDFPKKCNTEMAELCKPDKEDETLIEEMLKDHLKFTGSKRAAEILEDFSQHVKRFVKVLPLEYKAVLEQRKMSKKLETKES